MFPMLRAGFVLWFGLAMLARIEAQPLPEAAPAMARSISSLLPRRATVSLEFQALAAVAPSEWSSFRAALRDELRKTGTEVTETAQPESLVRVVISENPRGLLLVAEVGSSETRQIVMAPWVRSNAGQAKPVLRLEITPIAEQTEPILDVWIADSGLDALLLSPGKVTAMHLTNGKWMSNGLASFASARPTPRDPRGRLISSAGTLGMYLPGTTCTGQGSPRPVFTCEPTNMPWLLSQSMGLEVHWASDRNVLESQNVRGSFYNAAGGWIASSRGKIETSAGEIVPSTESWGSDLASVANLCGSAGGDVVIVASAGDVGGHDQVQAFTLPPEPPTAVSAALSLPGFVTALWASERPGQATLVIRNSKTGNYEASRLGLACAE